MYTGEIISLIVAISWTVTALLAEVASKRITPLGLNVIRMTMSLIFLGILMWCCLGVPYPKDADGETWLWLSLSGFVGYVLGDYCLFNSYLLIGSRFGQLFMTIAPAAAAIFGWILLGETMSWLAIAGMLVTIFGIGMSVMSKEDKGEVQKPARKLRMKLPVKGVLFGIGAGLGQGIGLVLSKVGMTHYAFVAAGNQDVLDLMPFSSTFIRAITGLIGFVVMMIITGKTRSIAASTRDGKGMLVALGATIFGPFVGVSLSLMATLYTSTGIAQTIMAMTPIFILLPSWYFFKQKVTVLEIVGAVISVLGVTLFFI